MYAKTYNSGDSLVVTHLTTNPPVSCLSTAERTGSAIIQDPMVVCERTDAVLAFHNGQLVLTGIMKGRNHY